MSKIGKVIDLTDRLAEQGKLSKKEGTNERGSIKLKIGISKGFVIVDFINPIRYIGLTPAEAKILAEHLIERANEAEEKKDEPAEIAVGKCVTCGAPTSGGVVESDGTNRALCRDCYETEFGVDKHGATAVDPVPLLPMASKDEFEKAFCEKLGMTVEKLHELGCFAEVCDCKGPGCPGWKVEFEKGKKEKGNEDVPALRCEDHQKEPRSDLP